MPSKQKKNFNKEGFSKVKKVYRFFLTNAFQCSRRYFVASGFNTIFEAFYPFVDMIFLPLIIDELMNGRNLTRIICYLVGLLSGNLIIGFLSSFTSNEMDKYSCKIENYFVELMSQQTMEMDFALTEDRAALDQLDKAKEGLNFAGAGWTIKSLKELVTSIIQLGGVITLIAINAPVILIIAIAVMTISAIINQKSNNIEIQFYGKRAAVNRAFNYSCVEIADIKYGKDIRLFNAIGMLMYNTGRYIHEINNYWKEQADKRIRINLFNSFFYAIRDGLTYFYLGFAAIMGSLSIGIFAQMLKASEVYSGSMSGIIYGIQDILKLSNYAVEYVNYMEYPAALEKGNRHPIDQEHTLEFSHVSFCYPNSDVQVLKDVSIVLQSGEHLSVVGLNGAGKTTFIKLLCRLYDVTEGEILLDGVNIKEYDYKEYIKLFSPVFQDFKLLAFSARENIAGFDQDGDEELMKLFDMAGMGEKLRSLPDGIDTPIFKGYEENGVELSGGEQQKLAIARAVYRNAPIMILDEPTAALDPIAEYEIYRQFNEIIGGKTAVYISHRLSSCKFCDRIAVFSEGTITEYGTHGELCSRDGSIYAEMWAAQARYYQ